MPTTSLTRELERRCTAGLQTAANALVGADVDAVCDVYATWRQQSRRPFSWLAGLCFEALEDLGVSFPADDEPSVIAGRVLIGVERDAGAVHRVRRVWESAAEDSAQPGHLADPSDQLRRRSLMSAVDTFWQQLIRITTELHGPVTDGDRETCNRIVRGGRRQLEDTADRLRLLSGRLDGEAEMEIPLTEPRRPEPDTSAQHPPPETTEDPGRSWEEDLAVWPISVVPPGTGGVDVSEAQDQRADDAGLFDGSTAWDDPAQAWASTEGSWDDEDLPQDVDVDEDPGVGEAAIPDEEVQGDRDWAPLDTAAAEPVAPLGGVPEPDDQSEEPVAALPDPPAVDETSSGEETASADEPASRASVRPPDVAGEPLRVPDAPEGHPSAPAAGETVVPDADDSVVEDPVVEDIAGEDTVTGDRDDPDDDPPLPSPHEDGPAAAGGASRRTRSGPRRPLRTGDDPLDVDSLREDDEHDWDWEEAPSPAAYESLRALDGLPPADPAAAAAVGIPPADEPESASEEDREEVESDTPAAPEEPEDHLPLDPELAALATAPDDDDEPWGPDTTGADPDPEAPAASEVVEPAPTSEVSEADWSLADLADLAEEGAELPPLHAPDEVTLPVEDVDATQILTADPDARPAPASGPEEVGPDDQDHEDDQDDREEDGGWAPDAPDAQQDGTQPLPVSELPERSPQEAEAEAEAQDADAAPSPVDLELPAAGTAGGGSRVVPSRVARRQATRSQRTEGEDTPTRTGAHSATEPAREPPESAAPPAAAGRVGRSPLSRQRAGATPTPAAAADAGRSDDARSDDGEELPSSEHRMAPLVLAGVITIGALLWLLVFADASPFGG